ncbi:MAG: AMP-dependent synthetase [Sulfobacillus acidophilus]|uniref:AMP-dependent synthetase n=1 Tax=Sulfobacillus acidophilus TaxID=53633 RepID=A0A2T2WGX2_9FIRM|nr:MAG: AMP-dependent synthetase [Sulfobacillus acidophilus]
MKVQGDDLPSNRAWLAWPEVLNVCQNSSNREALITPHKRFTYTQMAERVFQFQRLLTSLGLKAGDRLVTLLGNDWVYPVTYWAALGSGIIFVPLNTRLVKAEIQPILDEVEPRLIISDERYEAQVPDNWRHALLLQTGWTSQSEHLSSDIHPPFPVEPLDVAVLLYTSGTTGKPKGVMLTHQNIAVQFYQASRVLVPMSPADRVVSLYPLFHSAQHVFLQAPLTIGATSVIDEFHPDRVAPLLSNEHITIFFGVPAMYHILLQNPKFSAEHFPHIRLLTYGASIMPMETILTLRQRFPEAEIRNLYGQTENSPAVTGLDDRYALSKPGSVGRPLPGMTVSIFDDNNHEVAAGVVGEIVTQGINLMKGYFKNEDAFKEVVRDNWYHTGDLGYLDEEGFLYVVDRKKDMIIRGGQNIYPAEIENVLYTHTDILECAVIGIAHPILGEEVAAIVVRRPQSTVTEEMIIQYTRERIAAYKVPVRVRFVDELPHNASGKILKRELRELAQQGAL